MYLWKFAKAILAKFNQLYRTLTPVNDLRGSTVGSQLKDPGWNLRRVETLDMFPSSCCSFSPTSKWVP